MRLGKDTWWCGLEFRCVAGCQSKLWRSPSKVHGTLLLYLQQKVVACNMYLWSERSGDLPDGRCCYLEIIIISTPTRPAEFVSIPLGVERPAPSI
jgi:hypothetical protein